MVYEMGCRDGLCIRTRYEINFYILLSTLSLPLNRRLWCGQKNTVCLNWSRFHFCPCFNWRILLEEPKSPTSVFDDFINDSIRNSVTIPADLSMQLVQKRIRGQEQSILIVDGSPRSLDQARAFEEKVVLSRRRKSLVITYFELVNEYCIVLM